MRVDARHRRSQSRFASFDRRMAPDTYITDGSNLFRCLSVHRSPDTDPILALEDCLTLEVIVLPLTESVAIHARVVRQGRRPASAPGGSGPLLADV